MLQHGCRAGTFRSGEEARAEKGERCESEVAVEDMGSRRVRRYEVCYNFVSWVYGSKWVSYRIGSYNLSLGDERTG